MRSTVVEVEADTSEQAIDKVEEAYHEDKICLNSVGYIDDGTCFYDETDKWKSSIDREYCTNFQKIS